MRADGTTFPVELTITRIDVPGPPTFTGYLRDITERKAAEAELRASRARIVEAADAARRRLERDLHDGAQQRLVELALDLRMARARLDDDPARARRAARRRARRPRSGDAGSCASWPAASTRRRSPRAGCGRRSRRSSPARASRHGSSRCRTRASPRRWRPRRTSRSPRASPTRPASRGGAAWRSRSTRVDGLPARRGPRRRPAAAPTRRAGSGLRGLADRVAALDGELEVVSPAGGGTVLQVEIPCES